MSEILIGTSGYDYPEWKGIFYPNDLPRKDFLSFYATKLNALEINSTFYSMPTVESLKNFYEKSEGKLKFSIKANKLLTHIRKSDWKNSAFELKTALKILIEKNSLSSVLFQFPKTFNYSNENRWYLSNLLSEFSDFPNVVEFRNVEWIKDSVFEGLAKRKTKIAFCDLPNPKKQPNLYSEDLYIRFHQRNENAWYSHCENMQQEFLKEELQEFLFLSELETKIQIYFNNSCIKNACELRDML